MFLLASPRWVGSRVSRRNERVDDDVEEEEEEDKDEDEDEDEDEGEWGVGSGGDDRREE